MGDPLKSHQMRLQHLELTTEALSASFVTKQERGPLLAMRRLSVTYPITLVPLQIGNQG